MTGVDFLIDTNIFIYIHEAKEEVEPFLHYELAYSSITKIELLGYSQLNNNQILLIEQMLNDCSELKISDEVINKAIILKRNYNIKLPDAIIAATALLNNLPLVTADKGFEKIDELSLIEVRI
jgi:predicted nucleic acid-binding protein